MEHDTDSQSIFESLKDAGAGDGWNVVKILLDIRAIDKDEITAGISAAQSAQKAKRTAIICCTIAVIAMLITGVVFAALASGIQIEHTVTTETVEQDASDGGSNMYLGDNAQYVDGGGDG